MTRLIVVAGLSLMVALVAASPAAAQANERIVVNFAGIAEFVAPQIERFIQGLVAARQAF